MQYADNTNTSVVPSIQSVTKVMKNWNVDAENTEGLLDRLVLASQKSGAGVDYLSDMVVTNKAMLQQMGYTLDESIALMAMFEYEGLNASSIMMGFRSAITVFSEDGRDASVAMQEVIEKIGSMASESEATALSIDTFGSRAGAELAYAIRNSKFEIDDWISVIGKAEGTLAKTDEAADTLGDKWTQATNKVSAAFTGVLEPVTSGISNAFANVVGGIGDFLEKNPVVTAGLVGLAVGIGAVSAALAIKALILPVVTFLTGIFGATLSAALWPLTLIAAAIALLVAGFTLLVGAFEDSNNSATALTIASREQEAQLNDLNAEHERTVELYGESSYEAQSLQWQIDDLTAAYEASKQTLEEYKAETEEIIAAHDELMTTYNDTIDSINLEEQGTMALIDRLSELGAKTDLTAGEQEQMRTIVDKLNESLPQLALSYDDVTASLSSALELYKTTAAAQAEQERWQESQRAYTEALKEQVTLKEQIAKTEENLRLETERMNNMSDWDHFWTGGE